MPKQSVVADAAAAAMGTTLPHSIVAVAPEMAAPPPIAAEAVAVAIPAVMAPAGIPAGQISSRPAVSPARVLARLQPGRLRSQRAPHSMTNKVTSSTISTIRPSVASAEMPSHPTNAPEQVPKWAADDQQPFFDRLVNATCGVTDILTLGPAYLIPRGGPAYLSQAHFFRSRDGRPWVTLYYTGGQEANLPVTISDRGIEFTRAYDTIYRLSPSHNNHLVSFAKHPAGGTVDFVCSGDNIHPL